MFLMSYLLLNDDNIIGRFKKGNIYSNCMELNITYYSKRTSGRLVYEAYNPKSSSLKACLVLFAGLGARKGMIDTYNWDALNRSNYFGKTPAELAIKTQNKVYVVYPPGVSRFIKKGYYSEETEREQLEAAMELVKDMPFTPITHSFSTLLGIKLLSRSYREKNLGNQATQVLPGVISSVNTNAEDALTDERENPRKVLGIKWIYLYKIFQHIPLPSYFPLASPAIHDPIGAKPDGNKNWGLSPLVNTLSAKYALEVNGNTLAESLKDRDQRPLGIVTLKDNIYNSDKQLEVLEKIMADIFPLETGHRWMTEPAAEDAIKKIVEHHQKSLEGRLATISPE
jgi:hypothetical protein